MIDVRVEIYSADAFAKLASLLNKMEEIPPEVVDDINRGMADMETVAKGNCPVDTGNLRDSIRVEGDFPTYSLIADAVNPQGQPYAAYVEHGTSKQEAQPFMWPAVDAIMADLPGMIKMHYRNWLESSTGVGT